MGAIAVGMHVVEIKHFPRSNFFVDMVQDGLWLGVNFVVALDYFSGIQTAFLIVVLPDCNTRTLYVLFVLVDLRLICCLSLSVGCSQS